ncbi:MAG TPA: phosphoribosylglycinamide formyltransferase [Polyangiaceae bacterium]|nr:phosphoribosylglycinamide formyltransferase [Polyangiaceae bacterium]
MTLALGVLISGTGTNMGAVLDAIAAGTLDARVAVVVSNRAEARGLERARAANVETVVLPHKAAASREAYDAAVVDVLRAAGVEWVVMAGFMRVVTPVLLDAFVDRVVNIHPALLPAFPGVDAQRQALEYGVKITGCTVHFVDAGVDSGPIIAQATVPVLEGDDRDRLAARILKEEHALLVASLRAIAEGRVHLEPRGQPGARRRVLIRGEVGP